MRNFSLQNKSSNLILSVHVENLDSWLFNKGTSFHQEWIKFQDNEYSINSNIRTHFENLILTYGKETIEAWLKIHVKKTA